MNIRERLLGLYLKVSFKLTVQLAQLLVSRRPRSKWILFIGCSLAQSHGKAFPFRLDVGDLCSLRKLTLAISRSPEANAIQPVNRSVAKGLASLEPDTPKPSYPNRLPMSTASR